MEHYEWKDLTIGIVRQLLMEDEFRAYPFASLALQAYLRDTAGDVRDLLAWAEARGTPMGVRLVKGAYWDYETIMHRQRGWPVPVFARKDDTDASYEHLIPLLLEHHAVIRPAFGTHNLRHVAMVMAEAEGRGLAAKVMELQMLYGMAEPLQGAVVDAGYRLRVYAPVGELIPGMAYLVRRLLENTSNESFVRARFVEGRDLDELVRAPAVDHLPSPNGPVRRTATDPARPSPYAPEPTSEWRRADVRSTFATAVRRAGADARGGDVPAFVAGHDVRTRDTIVSVDPGDPSTVVARSAACGPAE